MQPCAGLKEWILTEKLHTAHSTYPYMGSANSPLEAHSLVKPFYQRANTSMEYDYGLQSHQGDLDAHFPIVEAAESKCKLPLSDACHWYSTRRSWTGRSRECADWRERRMKCKTGEQYVNMIAWVYSVKSSQTCLRNRYMRNCQVTARPEIKSHNVLHTQRKIPPIPSSLGCRGLCGSESPESTIP